MDELVLVAVLAVVCSFICGVAAHHKGRSGLAWLVAGLLFGPFALLAILIVSRDVGGQRKAALERGEMKTCPMCAEIIQKAALKCRYCGADLTVEPSSAAIG